MSNLTLASASIIGIVVLAGAALGTVVFLSARRIEDSRLRYVAAGFYVLAINGLFSIYTIKDRTLHHEVTEAIGAILDAVMVFLFACPLWMRER